MRLLALVQGNYGRRMVEAWGRHGPPSWHLETLEITPNLPAVIEETAAFLPPTIPQGDLLISLGEHPGVAELLPEIVKAAGARSVIAPVDSRAWLPPGLARQVQRALEKIGVKVVFPVPFCALEEGKTADPLIEEFARSFGRPRVQISLEGDRVKEVLVIKSAPCGSTYFVAEGLKGVRVPDAEGASGILHHNYPCLATMTVDWEFHDTLMHRAGYFTKEAVKEALKGSTTR